MEYGQITRRLLVYQKVPLKLIAILSGGCRLLFDYEKLMLFTFVVRNV